MYLAYLRFVSINRTRNQENNDLVEELASVSTQTDMKIQTAICDAMTILRGNIYLLGLIFLFLSFPLLNKKDNGIAYHLATFVMSDALSADHEATREMGSISNLCLDHLEKLQGDHNDSISKIRDVAERCLVKEYLVRVSPSHWKSVPS